MRNYRTLIRGIGILFVLASLILAVTPALTRAESENPTVVVLSLEGPISPLMIEYLNRGFKISNETDAVAIIIELNTPGGDVSVMNSIVQLIRSSDIPVVIYVSPRGAMAASAGTVITLAGHLSAMAPETTIGAASPVGSQGEDLGDTMESKLKEILKASVRSITEQRNPEAIRLAEDTIENAKAVSSTEALQVGLVDFEADTLDDLISQINQREVTTKQGTQIINTTNAEVRRVENTFIEEFLLLLTNPNFVFILLSIGVQAILIELSNPGGWVAGFIGVVALLLAVYGLGVLPVNWFGILFIVVSFVLFILDIKAPTHGALTVAGAASFIIGALVLFNSTRLPGFPKVSVPLVIGTGIVIAGSFLIVVTLAVRAQSIPIKTGVDRLLGQKGWAKTEINPTGQVMVGGMLWVAKLEKDGLSIQQGERIEVMKVEGLRLRIRKSD